MKAYPMKLLLFSGAVSLFILSSCSKNNEGPVKLDPVPIELTSDQMSLVGSGNSFAFDIFSKVTGSAAESENIIISPLSISVALSMTLNGAAGETKSAMLNALRSSDLTPEKINAAYKDLSKALLGIDKRVLLTVANSVWTENDFPAKEQFRNVLINYYDAEARSFDINDPGVPDDVNEWIEGKTNGLIKDMVDQLDPQIVMLLVNAIYFKGKWNSQFDPGNTVNEDFRKNASSTAAVPMMKQENKFRAFDGDGYVIAEFPYGQGNFVMDVILPDDINGVNTIIRNLTPESFNEMVQKMQEQEVRVTFPRFKYGYKNELNQVLADMGMGLAFTPDADFSNLSDVPVNISKVLHQAFIETNEEGTEAAAATVVEMEMTSMPVGPLTLRLDHPFLYVIRETTTNTVLFMGRLSDPLAN